MFCTSCGHQFEGTYCPECGNAAPNIHKSMPHPMISKKPFYQKWWFWAIVVLLVIVVVFGDFSNESNINSSASGHNTGSSTSTATTAPKAASPKIPEEFTEVGRLPFLPQLQIILLAFPN